jgi:hypothetical protein
MNKKLVTNPYLAIGQGKSILMESHIHLFQRCLQFCPLFRDKSVFTPNCLYYDLLSGLTEPSGVAEATFCVNVSELVWLLFMIGVRDLLAIVPSNHLPFPEFSKGENAFSSPQQTRLLHMQPRFPIPFVVDLDIKLV